jgi:phenylacetate-CoA ligase
MLHRYLLSTGYLVRDKEFLRCYDFVRKNEFKPVESLIGYQEERLKKLIDYSYNKVPYYRNLFRSLNLSPEDIQSKEDLQKIPILTKETIRSNYKEFIPDDLKFQKFVTKSTGGSTGHPLQYRVSMRDWILGFANMYAKWGYCGYDLGDKVGVLAGSALIPSSRSNFVDKVREFMINEKRFSSFDLSDAYMDKILAGLNEFKPRCIRGYASSIYLFAEHISASNLKLEFKPRSIFSTSEVLFDKQRELIEKVFGCKVFNQYGLNDGGVSAWECPAHEGLHIDMLRSIMEVVDDEGHQLGPGKEGHILATGLHNYAQPFIRYQTGDLGILSGKECSCQREMPLLRRVVGRVSDFITSPQGKKIHGEFFSHIFWEIAWAKQFQVVQNSNNLLIKILPDDPRRVEPRDLDKLKNIILDRTGPMGITSEIVDKIETTTSGKWKFIAVEA